MRGYSDARIYPLGGPDVAKAKRLAGGHGGRAVMRTCNGPVCKRNAEIVRANPKAIDIDVEIRQFSDEKLFVDKLPRPRGSWDIVDSRWYADYADPFETVNVLFDPAVKNSIDFGGFDAAIRRRRRTAAPPSRRRRRVGPRRAA
jgi:ABC-type oligopeptide transport system substrate-binding subunit